MRADARAMSEWNFMDYASKDNLLRTVREQSDQMLALASDADVWEEPTAAGHWQVRDIIGHLVDTTEGYFAGWIAAAEATARSGRAGGAGDGQARRRGCDRVRSVPQDELLARLERTAPR